MKIIEHGNHGKFTVRGTCPVCGCVFETTVTRGENNIYDCKEEMHITDCNGYPVEFLTSCPECRHQNILMKVMNRE